MSALGDKALLARLVATHLAGRAGRRLAAMAMLPASLARRTPERLLIAPHDLRTTDPVGAADFYAGTWRFAGKTVSAAGRSPFAAAAPSAEWAQALHGFGWLRHLRAADTALARANGRALVDEWIALRGGPDRAARRLEVSARRLISWFCHAPLILEGADRAFYRRFLRSIARQTRRLDRAFVATPDGLPRLTAAVALAYAGLCLSGEARLLKSASRRLAEELDRQILADGGHVSRNPAAVVAALLDLLPLRQAFTARDVAPPQALLGAVDRMMPMLRFFRHADGEFAQFNGAGGAEPDLVATLLAYDDARGATAENAPHSGYQRLAAPGAVVLLDAGAPPPLAVSGEAHAGCLAFEFSGDGQRIIVNCGAPSFGGAEWAEAARATAAHSTAAVGGASSARFAPAALRRLLGAPIVAGPGAVPVRREPGEAGARVTASHDGYAGRFGLLHERAIELADDGRALAGEDAFPPAPGAARASRAPEIALRFHLHPAVRASVTQDGRAALLALPGGEAWTFSAQDAELALEESVHLSGASGPRRSEQIVIAAAPGARIAWSLTALSAEPQARVRKMPSAATLFEAAERR